MTLKRIPTAVYLDYAASTPVDPQVADVMAAQLRSTDSFANASAETHQFGKRAAALAAAARLEVADFMQASAREVYFTSGATEANNLAVMGAARYRQRHGRHIVTALTEHPAVLAPIAALEREGFEVTRLATGASGVLDPDAVAEALRNDTVLVAVMLVNNELGAINPIAEIALACQERGIRLHVDAAQAVGRVDVATATANASSVALSAHKCYGPKGVGALIARAEIAPEIEPLQFGGGQEQGLRPGTLATHQLVGMAEAIRLCRGEAAQADLAHCANLSERLLAGLADIQGCRVNGDRDRCVPGIVNFTLTDLNGESLLSALAPLALARGSACSSAHGSPSQVLRSIGLSDAEAQSSLRASFGRFSTAQEIDLALEAIRSAVDYLRRVGGDAPIQGLVA